MLYSLDFSGNDGITLQADDKFDNLKAFDKYSPHQWLDINLNGTIDHPVDHQYPYAYVSGSGMNVTAVFKFKLQKWLKAPDPVQIRGFVFAVPGDPAQDVFKASF